jgi:uncharacterized iron-regulated membrane protein
MQKLMRQWHIWGSVISLFAIVIFFATGYFMQIRRDVPVVMPKSLQAKTESGKKIKYTHNITHDDILQAVIAQPEMGVKGWDDIYQFDWRPKKSMVKVKANNLMEAQVNTATGKVEQVMKRNYDWISRLHAGEMVGPGQHFNQPSTINLSDYFLIATLIFIFLLLSGLYLWIKKLKTATWKSLTTARGIHLWLTPILILPIFVMTLSGLFLQAKHYLPESYSPNDQYKQIAGAPVIIPQVTMAEFLKILQTNPAVAQANIESWKDVWRVYTYPHSGHMVARVYNKHDIGYEVRINSVTGEVERAIPRYTDWIENIHEGRFWESKDFRWMSWGVFLISEIIFILVMVTGVILAFRYFKSNRRSNEDRRARVEVVENERRTQNDRRVQQDRRTEKRN